MYQQNGTLNSVTSFLSLLQILSLLKRINTHKRKAADGENPPLALLKKLTVLVSPKAREEGKLTQT